MSLETMIRDRTQAKEMQLSQPFVMTKEEWLAKGAIFRGTLKQASKSGFYTIRVCEKLKQPVTEEEKQNCKDFALFASCNMEFCINRKRPCLPVFFREMGDK